MVSGFGLLFHKAVTLCIIELHTESRDNLLSLFINLAELIR